MLPVRTRRRSGERVVPARSRRAPAAPYGTTVTDSGPGASLGVPLLDLFTLAGQVGWPDSDAERAARAHRLEPAPGRPAGPFGQLTGNAQWLAGVTGRWPPGPPLHPHLVIVTATHAGMGHTTLDDPVAVAAQLTAGRLPIFELATQHGIAVQVVDAGENGAIDSEAAAMTTDVLAAVDAGARLVDQLVDQGVDLLIVTNAAAGASTAAAAVISVLTRAEPTAVAGRGTGVDDAGWAATTAAIRDARRLAMAHRDDVVALLAQTGGLDLAQLMAMMLRAAGRATPVILDGVSAAAAALLAREATPRIIRWLRLAHRSTEPAEQLAAEHLGLVAMCDLQLTGVGISAGIGGVLAVDMIRAAALVARSDLSISQPSADN